ncbi:hypothetical protein BDV96DRAFT_337079 [Lophiotrema nucula]|uniref:C2H2-type domain-containing protein n=1 Tax=Lophiotrema nucula TaxID=690887 RepID=A0A6A5YJ76_9PLEO|nr:hypothetical protein BDV96DRAFT_337079 [Lophiotrema nucula]
MYSDEPRKAAPCEQQSWKEERRRRLVDQGYRIDEKSHRAHQPHKSLDEDEKSPRVQSGTDCNAETLRPRGYVVLEDSSLEASGPRMRRSERNPFMRSLQSHSSHSRSKGDSQPGTGHRVASAVRDLLSHNNSDPRLRSDPRKRPDTPGIIRSLGEHGRHVRFVSQSNMTHLAPIREEALKHRPSQGSFPDCLVPSSESGSSNMYQQVLSEMKSLSVTESTESTLFRKRSTKTFEGVYAPVTACAPSAHDRDDRSTGYVASSSTPSSHSTNEHQIRKRERDGDKYPDDDDDDSEDDDRRRNKKGKGPEGKGSHLGLRCPFYLRDPEKYSKIQACSNGKGFADMARLRHHLKRDHTQPLRCPRCREEMKSLQDCDDHLRQTVLCDNRPQPIDDRLTAVQWDAISSRRGSMRSLQTLEEKWKALYQMIFPGESRIPSPCES